MRTVVVCPNGTGRTERTTLATSAQKKLRHIVLIGQLIVISCLEASRQPREARQDGLSKRASSEKSTPPIGLPKATATPVAEAAVTISRILAGYGSKGISIEEFLDMRSLCSHKRRTEWARRRGRTLTPLEARETACHKVADGARDVDGRTLFADR